MTGSILLPFLLPIIMCTHDGAYTIVHTSKCKTTRKAGVIISRKHYLNHTPHTLSASDRAYLEVLAIGLAEAPREGEATDSPEGARYIRISDTLARDIAATLLRMVE